MSENEEYRTETGYAGAREGALTPAAEDYLEMITRLSADGSLTSDEAVPCVPVPGKPVRISVLAEELHVTPSSASRMAQSMAAWGYVDFRRYGYITLTDKGREAGEFLLRRHRIVLDFLTWLTGHACFTETERIEHHLSRETVECMARVLTERAVSAPIPEPKQILRAEMTVIPPTKSPP